MPPLPKVESQRSHVTRSEYRRFYCEETRGQMGRLFLKVKSTKDPSESCGIQSRSRNSQYLKDLISSISRGRQ